MGRRSSPYPPDAALEPQQFRENGMAESLADGPVQGQLQVLAMAFAGDLGEKQADQAQLEHHDERQRDVAKILDDQPRILALDRKDQAAGERAEARQRQGPEDSVLALPPVEGEVDERHEQQEVEHHRPLGGRACCKQRVVADEQGIHGNDGCRKREETDSAADRRGAVGWDANGSHWEREFKVAGCRPNFPT